ncbi:CCN family member 1-like [Conger conger]|uniref:CCN family member 1-like n=1 Tax=Conger conger TaxID=82655 RepID=UPI002A59BAD7|nr:CCN family member 1-like [Conger conger]
MEKYFYFMTLAMATFSLVGGSCPAVCECPAAPLGCPPGVSAVADGCGCCKVCAAQLNQDCHSLKPCDHHKGLECNYGNDVARTWGVCRARLEGRTCEYSGRIYQNGESFRAGCKHQCTCIDGAVGCAPLCPSQLPLASPSCPAPRLLKVPGQCCLSVDCGKGAPALPPTHPNLQPYPYPYPNPYPYPHPYKPDKSLDNELVEMGKKRSKQDGYKHMAAWMQVGGECIIQTTSWSQCSRSCGMGVSSRVTNHNGQCRLVRETRLCTIRPCGSAPAPLKTGKKCSRTRKAPEPLRLSYAGCRSSRQYQPNYCGVCVDGRCCAPRRSRTVSVPFLCPDGERFNKAVMFVQSCKCSDDCGHLNEVALPPQHWLHGDTHKFID